MKPIKAVMLSLALCLPVALVSTVTEAAASNHYVSWFSSSKENKEPAKAEKVQPNKEKTEIQKKDRYQPAEKVNPAEKRIEQNNSRTTDQNMD